MRLLDKFVENFPNGVDKNHLRQQLFYYVPPCLFYGRYIDCGLRRDKYSRKFCGQDDISRCWCQEQKSHLPQHISNKMLEKFNKTW